MHQEKNQDTVASINRPTAGLQDVGEDLKRKVGELRGKWALSAHAPKGISLLFNLMHERRYSEADYILNLFLKDNPNHGVALNIKKQIDEALGKKN